MIRDLGITHGDESKVGYYVGMMVSNHPPSSQDAELRTYRNQQSLFFFTQAFTVLHWSRLSDHVGRKPVILFGLLGLSLSMYCFGLSRTFTGLVLSRALNGALSEIKKISVIIWCVITYPNLLDGNIGVIKRYALNILHSGSYCHGPYTRQIQHDGRVN